MSRAIAFAHEHIANWHIELPRLAVVWGCALALIAAGRALPV
jgi:hypothetical protein